MSLFDEDKPDRQWFFRLRQNNPSELLVFFGDSVAKSIYAQALPAAVTSFNALMSQLRVGVRLRSTDKKEDRPEPDENQYRGADIWVEVGIKFDGKVSGQDVSIDLKAEPLVRGHTHKISWDFGRGAEIRKAVILMKNAVMSDDIPQRQVGVPVLKVLAVHEFIHAVGLGNHTPGGGDFFQKIPEIRTKRNDPSGDVVKVEGGRTVPQQNGPELFLLESTIRRLHVAWPP